MSMDAFSDSNWGSSPTSETTIFHNVKRTTDLSGAIPIHCDLDHIHWYRGTNHWLEPKLGALTQPRILASGKR